jgi:tetratricopeptide (TPR) repeat protein
MLAYGKAIVTESKNEKKKAMLIEAIKESEAMAKHNMALTFAFELIKTDPLDGYSKKYLPFLSDQMKMRKKDDVAFMIDASFLRLFGSKGENEKLAASLPSWTKDPVSFLKEASKKTIATPTADNDNTESIRNYVDLCEAYALGHGKNPETPELLFKAAQLANTTRDFSKAISLFDWILTYYPEHKHAAMSLFLKGFTIENEFKNLDEAKKCYDLFLKKFPKDPLAKDVGFLLKNMGQPTNTLIPQKQ